MIPYKDDNPRRRFPVVTYALIALNAAAFVWMFLGDPERAALRYGAVPVSLLSFRTLQPIHPLLTVLSSMFLHGGALHLAGNMLYLHIFGDNVEDRLGRIRFVLFYAASGFVAAYAHAFTAPLSAVPMIGASGAVSGVLGAYLVLFPRARVYTIVFLLFYVEVVRLPALIVIGFWAIIQVVSGISATGTLGAGGGVAWFAHVGGFLFGMAAIKFLLPRRRRGEW